MGLQPLKGAKQYSRYLCFFCPEHQEQHGKKILNPQNDQSLLKCKLKQVRKLSFKMLAVYPQDSLKSAALPVLPMEAPCSQEFPAYLE